MKAMMIAMAAATTALTGIASAQTMTTPPPAPAPQAAAATDGEDRTRDDAIAKADRRFQRIDADRNGEVTQEEMRALSERREARGKLAKGGMRDRKFARLDADRNGSLNVEEHRALALRRFDRVDANRDGRIDDAERAAMRERRMARRGDMAPPPEAFEE